MVGWTVQAALPSVSLWMRTAALLVLLSWLGVFAAAIAPVLHQHVHCDAHSSDHHCLVTDYADGLLSTATPVVFLPLPALVETPAELIPVQFPILRSPPKVFPERGPPFLG